MAQNIAVMDIGSRQITVLIGERGVNNTICIHGMGSSTYSGFDDHNFVREQELEGVIGKAIMQAEAKAGRQIDKLYVGVPVIFTKLNCGEVNCSFDKPHKITEFDVENLYDNDSMEDSEDGYKLINSQPIFYMLDDKHKTMIPVGKRTRKFSGFMSYIFAENNFVKTIDKILEKLKINQYDYLSSLLAESLFLFDDEQRDNGAVLIDVGYAVTSIALVKGDGLIKQFSIPFGGGNITTALQNYLQISFKVAEKLKRMVNIALDVDENETYNVAIGEKMEAFGANQVNEVVCAKLSTLSKVIARCLALCEFPDETPYYFTGGGISYIGGARIYVGKKLKREARQIAPNLPQYKHPHLSALFGLMDMVLDQEDESSKSFFAKLFGR